MNGKSGKWKVESRSVGRRCAPTTPSPAFRFPLSAFPRLRRAVTLIELLITITIIATLSAAFLGASRAAMEHSHAARTKSTIAKLNGLLMERWASYTTRRADIHPDILNKINTAAVNNTVKGQMLADLRLLATRELMKLEMPDSWSNILLNPVGSSPQTQPHILSTFPSLRNAYLRRYNQVIFNKPPGTDNNTEEIIANQGAECLYMIIMLGTGDGEARTLFSQQDIGDTDGDGAPEFLDGWGRPINFIRWPAGFVARSDLMSGDADADHDPFDAFRRDQLKDPWPEKSIYSTTTSPTLNLDFIVEMRDMYPAFRLVPLIYSAGSDGEADIDDQPYTGSATPPPTSLDPYAFDPDAGRDVFGLPFDMNNDGDDNSLDNFHNHLQDGR